MKDAVQLKLVWMDLSTESSWGRLVVALAANTNVLIKNLIVLY